MNIKKINSDYWENRAGGYSDVNKEELAGVQRKNWSLFLNKEIMEHFPGRSPEEIRILDIGAGPGFLSIILAEQGFSVTAADGADNMLREARRNAGAVADRIRFVKEDAEDLDFPDASFDVILSRNLTWNLPHPEKAYTSWMKALKKGGMILVFDANWYSYLVDEEKLAEYMQDRDRVREEGLEDYNIGENFDVMEKIAEKLPMTDRIRPAWDADVLKQLGAGRVDTVENIGRRLYSEKELINYRATPLFMIRAIA